MDALRPRIARPETEWPGIGRPCAWASRSVRNLGLTGVECPCTSAVYMKWICARGSVLPASQFTVRSPVPLEGFREPHAPIEAHTTGVPWTNAVPARCEACAVGRGLEERRGRAVEHRWAVDGNGKPEACSVPAMVAGDPERRRRGEVGRASVPRSPLEAVAEKDSRVRGTTVRKCDKMRWAWWTLVWKYTGLLCAPRACSEGVTP